MRTAQFVVGILLLIALEVMKVYFIMPFGAQRSETIDLAYLIHTNIIWFRLIGLLLIFFPIVYYFRFGKVKAKVAVGILLVAYGFVFYMFNFKMLADKMFLQPENLKVAAVHDNKVEKER